MFEDQKAGDDDEGERKNEKHDEPVASLKIHGAIHATEWGFS
jgi:hypothetical protein